MQSFYLNIGQTESGPFTADELLSKNITRNTPVWADGYADWLPAGDVPELADLIKTVVPTYKSFGRDKLTDAQKTQETKENFRAAVWTVLILIVIAFLLFIFIGRDDRRDNSPNDQRFRFASYFSIHSFTESFDASSPISV